MKINNTTLCWISKMGRDGAPLRALFMANNYLEADSALRAALVKKTMQKVAVDNRLARAAFAGLRVAELDDELKAEFSRLNEKQTQKTEPVIRRDWKEVKAKRFAYGEPQKTRALCG